MKSVKKATSSVLIVAMTLWLFTPFSSVFADQAWAIATIDWVVQDIW